MPTFSTLDAKLLNDAIGTVNDNLTVHHKENATTLLDICKHLGEHFTGHIYAFDRIEKKLNKIIERLSPSATFSFIPHNQVTPIPDATWQTSQATPAQDLRDTAEHLKHLAEHGNKPFVSKPNQFNIHHKDSPSFQESNGVQGEPCQKELQKLRNRIAALEKSEREIAKEAVAQNQANIKLLDELQELKQVQRTASHLAEKEALARQQLFNKSQALENLHQAYNKEVQKLSEILNELSQVNIRNQVLSNKVETLNHEKEELQQKMNSMFIEYQQQRIWAENEIRQLKDTIVKMQMEKHSSIVSVVSGRSPQSNEDQTSK